MVIDGEPGNHSGVRQLTLDLGEELTVVPDVVSEGGKVSRRVARRPRARSEQETPEGPRPSSPTIDRLIGLRELVGYEELGLRWRRCTSWLAQAEQEIWEQKYDAAFICCWIAFNAAYSVDTPDPRETFELESIRKYFTLLRELDHDGSIERELFDNETRWGQIEDILNNHYIYAPYWNSREDDTHQATWQDSLNWSMEKVRRARSNRDVGPVLEEMFSRLYVLRNQLFHGAATYNGSLNRRQVQWGAALLYLLLPVFLELMFRNPGADWGVPKYPALNRGAG